MKEKIKQILSEIKNDPLLVEKIADTSDIVNDIGIDSLQMINFILRIEDEFDIEIDFDEFDLSHLKSVDSFHNFIASKKQEEE